MIEALFWIKAGVFTQRPRISELKSSPPPSKQKSRMQSATKEEPCAAYSMESVTASRVYRETYDMKSTLSDRYKERKAHIRRLDKFSLALLSHKRLPSELLALRQLGLAILILQESGQGSNPLWSTNITAIWWIDIRRFLINLKPFVSPAHPQNAKDQPVLETECPSAILNEQDEDIVRSKLSDERTLLARLDEDIHRSELSERSLASLHGQRKACASRINRHATVLAPHRRLPPELLAKVFVELHGGERTVLPPGRTESPWVLRWVCSRWRQVALAERQLFWSDLEVRKGENHSPVGVAIVWVPRIWNQKETFPLSLRLGNYRFDPNTLREDLIISDILAPYICRIQNISLPTTLRHLPVILFSHSRPFSSLESLTLNVQHTVNLSCPRHLLREYQAVTIFSTSANLKEFTVAGNWTYFDNGVDLPIFYHLPWGQLTHLNFRNVRLPGEKFERILRKCKVLVSLEFGPIQEWSSAFTPEILLPQLRSLTVVMTHRTPYGYIFNFLRVPALTEIAIRDRSDLFDGQRELISMINQSGARVESLNLIGTGAPTFERLFPELPDLVTLVVSNSAPLAHSVFDKMIQGEILQHLEHLQCAGSPIFFLRLLQHRGLTTAEISYDTKNPYEELVEMEEMYEGMKLDLEKGGQRVKFEVLGSGIGGALIPDGLVAMLFSI